MRQEDLDGRKNGWPDRQHGGPHRIEQPETTLDPVSANQHALLRFAALFALCLLLVSGLPGPLVPVALSSLLMFAAFGSALVGAFRQESLWSPVLTHWDQAAGFWVASFLTKCLVDVEAVEAILESSGATP